MAKPDGEKTKKSADEVDLDVVLSEIGTAGKVSISRVEPDWCKGRVRSFELGSAEPISVDWIAQKCGGAKFHVRVYGPDGKGTLAFRTVEICGAPKNGHGIELVRGPDGEPIPVTQLQEARRRYAILNGLPVEGEQLGQQAPPAAVAPAPIDMTGMLQTMMQAQNQQNQTMITMMTNRVNSLERLLAQQIQNGPAVAQGQVVEPVDPMAQLTNTVKTIEQLEKIKGAMGVTNQEPTSDASMYTDLIKGFMEMELEKRRANVAQLQAQQQPAQLPPSVPPPGAQPVPAPPPVQGAQPPVQGAQLEPQFDPVSGKEIDPVILMQAMSHVEGLPRSERLKIASAVLGEEIDDGSGDADADWTEDPPELENPDQGGQKPMEGIGSSYSDETGEDQGSFEPPCSDPNIPDPSAPQNSGS